MCSTSCLAILCAPYLCVCCLPFSATTVLWLSTAFVAFGPFILVVGGSALGDLISLIQDFLTSNTSVLELVAGIVEVFVGNGNRTDELDGGCIFNDVDQLLSTYVDSTGFSSFIDETSTPQEKAFQWLNFQNATEVQTCFPYFTLQKYVLAVLYYSTGGEDWAQQGNFLTDDNVCLWKGVFCGEGNMVIKTLAMDASDLDGTIPAELGLLSNLEKLKMASNALSGPIPTTLGGLESLEELNLGDNDLTGSIPTELASMTALSVLSLYENNLEGTVPTGLGALGGLQGVFLFDNAVSGSVDWLCASGNVSVKVDCEDVSECACCLDCN